MSAHEVAQYLIAEQAEAQLEAERVEKRRMRERSYGDGDVRHGGEIVTRSTAPAAQAAGADYWDRWRKFIRKEARGEVRKETDALVEALGQLHKEDRARLDALKAENTELRREVAELRAVIETKGGYLRAVA